MSYLDVYKAANDPDFQGRCQVAMWKAAQNIADESEPSEIGPSFYARRDFYTKVLQERSNITAHQLAVQVLRNEAIAADPFNATDEAIQAQVDAVVPFLITIG